MDAGAKLVHHLDTPALVCDLDVLERNIREMAARCRDLDIPLRAHVKSHKVPEIARMQRAAGARGICCQKLAEAEIMVDAGFDDVLIPISNIVGARKVQRLMRLAGRARVSVSVDSLEAARGLSEGAASAGLVLPVLVELDTGFGRCGVQSPRAAVDLAGAIAGLPGLAFAGVLLMPSEPAVRPFLDQTLMGLRAAGLPAQVVSGGGTGRESASKALGCTETRSGSYVWEGGGRVRSPKLQDVRVRRALAQAINRQQIIDVVLSGQGSLPASYVSAPIPGSAKSLVNYYPYDAAKAQAALKEAGVSGLSLSLWAPSNGFWPAAAELVQGDLAKVGVTVSIEKIDTAAFGGRVTEGKHELFIWDGTQASADPNEFAYSFFLSTNPRATGRWGFANPTFDELTARADAEVDDAKRLPIVEQMQKLILDEVPQIMLYNGRFAAVTSTRVQNFKMLPFRHGVYMKDVSLA